MAQAGAERESIGDQGEALYASQIRDSVETDANIGKMIIIDVDTGDYEIDPTGIEAAHHLHAKRPNARLYGIRIGYLTAESFGGALERRPR